MSLTITSSPSTPIAEEGAYYVIFEQYLQPKKPQATLLAYKYGKRWRALTIKENRPQKSGPEENFKTAVHKVVRYIKMEKLRKAWNTHADNTTNNRWQNQFRKLNLGKELPTFLRFLKARNDEHLCKPKSGFEIYCEMASVHGFRNFVGAKTWQRILWCLIVSTAILLSIGILAMYYLMNKDTPVILYTESTTYPTWSIPFPAVTICNVNRISNRAVEEVLKKFSLPRKSVLPFLPHLLYTTDQTSDQLSDYRDLQHLLDSQNYTQWQMLQAISPNCSTELLRCRWKGRLQPCHKLFRRVPTPQGMCCAFNFHALPGALEAQPERTSSCGHKMGLTVLLEPYAEDYMAALTKSVGYQVFIHAPRNYPMKGTPLKLVQARTVAAINVMPRSTRASSFVKSLNVKRRRCYWTGEYQLEMFEDYSQSNCLSECQSRTLFEACGCVPLRLPRLAEWPICRVEQLECVREQRGQIKTFLAQTGDYKLDHYAENYICDCFPACEFNQYEEYFDSAPLNRSFSMDERDFFKDIEVKNHVLLHVFFGDLTAERLRLDVRENWLSYVGTFGGITGLFMGYSFVSAFEMIFFVFIRPACNWLTRQQIRFRIKRRQKKVAAEEARKSREKLKQEKLKEINNKVKDEGEFKDKQKNLEQRVEETYEEILSRIQTAEELAAIREEKWAVQGSSTEELNVTDSQGNALDELPNTPFYQVTDGNKTPASIEEESPLNEHEKRILLSEVTTPVLDKLFEDMALLIAKEIAAEVETADEVSNSSHVIKPSKSMNQWM